MLGLSTLLAATMAVGSGSASLPSHGDLEGDGVAETVELEPVPGQSAPRARVAITKRGVTTRTPWYPAWKLLVGDVDGDGKAEIVVALARTDRRDKRVRNRLYVYSWAGEGLLDRFRGSSFPRPFIDFALERSARDAGSRVVLLALDLPTRSFRREVYRWMHFGFAREDSVPLSCPHVFPDDPDRTMAPGLLARCRITSTPENP